jgi:hypothetical protein
MLTEAIVLNPYLPSLSGAWSEVGVAEPPAEEYVLGLVDLSQICRAASCRETLAMLLGRGSDQIWIRDLNPPEFWQMVERAGILESASREIGPENVIIYLNHCDDLGPDHPIVAMDQARLVTIRRLFTDLPYGFRLLRCGLDSMVTLMKPNPQDERFPLISRLEYTLAGPAMNRIEHDLARGYMDWQR